MKALGVLILSIQSCNFLKSQLKNSREKNLCSLFVEFNSEHLQKRGLPGVSCEWDS